MSLWGANVMFLFLEATDIPRARAFMEDALGLELIENRFHPPHERHGVAKYDAGNLILALNLATRMFEPQASDGIVTVLAMDSLREARIYARLHEAGLHPPREAGGVFFGHDHHGFAVRSIAPPPSSGEPGRVQRVEELRFAVDDLGESVDFYHGVLGLPVLHEDAGHAVLAGANLRFVLQRRHGGSPFRHDGLLTVFHTPHIEEAYESLADRGLDFRGLKVRYSEIGGAVRFVDPTGHVFCLYEPSEEALSWESGPRVRQLMSHSASGQVVH